MIRRITGTVVDTTLTSVVIEVAGVGYLVHTSRPGTDFTLESTVALWTHLAVRETALDLYGFSTRDELEIFELLLGLPKIGPKSAAQILNQADITLLKQAVSQEDPTYLSRMSGIGKKTAEKIVAGLRDPFANRGYHVDDTGQPTFVPAGWQQETIDALITLGYPQKDARTVVQALPEEIQDTTSALTKALQTLGSS